MDMRVRKRHLHIFILSFLVTAFGVFLFIVIGFLMSADLVEASAKTGVEITDCPNCQEISEYAKKEAEEIRIAEHAEKLANATGVVYLTYDDGPGDYTAALLDVLQKYDVKATFFVTGRGTDDLIKREYDEGHTVALHTWSHNYAYLYSSVANYYADLQQISDRVKNITGEESKLIRFPGGSSNTVSKRYDGRSRIMSTLTRDVEAKGYAYFDWNVDSDDAGRANSADVVYANVINRLKPGANVVLQHDIKPYSVEAVERIIQWCNDNNYVFEQLTKDSPTVHHGVNN